jgi:hypothetical protein
MINGPMAKAIEDLVHFERTHPPYQSKEMQDERRRKAMLFWDAIARATDQFYEDVKSGRITKD